MQNLILIVAGISVAVGIVLGALVVWLIYIQRRREVVDSLVRINHVVGRSGTVEIPFDPKTQGKVCVNVKGSLVDFVAFTDEPKGFRQGDRVFVVGMKANKVWVVSEDSIGNVKNQ
ncbi:MAG TPA: NfeD-like protein [Cyanobacteria bacterium UBA8803]|nr:NfeD-like protein [Cyanobacteria bacterium UBA9273]HBL60539.1 NfeD-like protein [Cyanobacteria bacterium UBA8803]